VLLEVSTGISEIFGEVEGQIKDSLKCFDEKTEGRGGGEWDFAERSR
jgi:hypothetical protein